MVPKRLALYPGAISPLAAFGTVCGMVFPILTFPMAFLFGLTELLIPELARCNAAGSRQRISHLVQKSLRTALLYGTLCGGILFLCANELCMALYKSEAAGRYLRWFSVLAVMLYCDGVTDAMIKGLGEQKASVRYNILTNSMDVAFLYILLPRYGIVGYFISFTVTHIINFFLSIRRLLRITKEVIPLHIPILTLTAAVFAVWAAQFVHLIALRIAAFVIIMLCLLFLLRILSKEDLAWIKGLVRKK
jgi:stage V sporulation protein B